VLRKLAARDHQLNNDLSEVAAVVAPSRSTGAGSQL
jgi:hypothetical protein